MNLIFKHSISHSKQGFTILELLIAIVILSFISLATTRLYQQSFKVRDTLQTEGEFYNAIRLGITIIEEDINQIYSPHLILVSKQPLDQKAATDLNVIFQGTEKRETKFWNPVISPSGIRPSRFVGEENSMSFVTCSNRRIYKESPESDFLKIKYELVNDKDPEDGHENTQILSRKTSTNVFDLEDDESKDKTLRMTPVLKGVKKLVFKYYSKKKAKWYTKWDTSTTDFLNIFPDVVEMSVEITGTPRKYVFTGLFRYRSEIFLNEMSTSI